MKYFLLLVFISIQSPAWVQNKDKIPFVSIKRTVIKHVQSGEYEVTITISKDSLAGFAAFYELFSEGGTFMAAAVKDAGASFSVTEKGVKFVWGNLPSGKSVEVSYTIKGISLTGADFPGHFKYIYDNEPRKLDLIRENVTYREVN